jgi:hypothetical protein
MFVLGVAGHDVPQHDGGASKKSRKQQITFFCIDLRERFKG